MTSPAYPEIPEMADLFTVYTADPQSIGSALTHSEYRSRQQDPLIVATSFDIALYPGPGQAPQVEGFRVGTRGFTELAGLSHLGPAVASLDEELCGNLLVGQPISDKQRPVLLGGRQ
jgi:hypothetical protein